ncbi:MAG: asparagine synthetase B [Nitrospirales bacterium]|nr:MAG: asparagine synthetase B [Nitrospirales bacterium]
MCGIGGWLGHLPNSKSYAMRMAKVLHHRGPDALGIKAWLNAGLIHTRLSILDLSTAGAQPMTNETQTIWVVFNGEIYNHKDLRRELESKGHVFKGHSDAEVLPHLYEEEGLLFVSRLKGMFAVAIYDTRSHMLVLTRDRFGIKPLFYAFGRDRFTFASEINAILEFPGIDERPDRQAVYDFAALCYIPAPETFYQGIRAIEPGELLVAQLSANDISLKAQYYHQWESAPDFGLSLNYAVEEASERILIAVRQQMESDVPLGALLSGGIDSSLVSAAAQFALNGNSLKTFNVRFSDLAYDETWAAHSVAEHIRSEHRTLEMGECHGTWQQITDLLLAMGQPFADTSIFAVNKVCRLMRQHVTVALSGDGGDEGFGGYQHFSRIGAITTLQAFPRALIKYIAMFSKLPVHLGLVPSSYPQRIRDFTTADDTKIIQTLLCWVRDEEHERLCFDEGLLPIRRFFEPKWSNHLSRKSSRLERLSAHATEVDTRLLLPNDFLFKVDMASMKESLEVRIPMLDESLYAFGLTLPHNLKVKGKTTKRILRVIAESRIPLNVARKPKWGFGIPMDTWVDSEFKIKLRESLLGSSSNLPEFFRPEVYRPIIEAFCDGRPHQIISRQGLWQRAIMLLAVHLYAEKSRCKATVSR